MNKRIRKKQERRQLTGIIRELAAIAGERERRQAAAVKRIVDAYGAYYEQKQAQGY